MTVRSFFVALTFGACAVACGRPVPVAERAAAVKPEAEAFMAAYARELLAGDREAVIARYDPRGAFSQGDGINEFWTMDKTRSFYRTTWKAPATFEFADLTYEPLGPDAVVVVGVFRWKEPGKALADTYSYTALLTRRDGQLRIRLEHESGKAS